MFVSLRCSYVFQQFFQRFGGLGVPSRRAVVALRSPLLDLLAENPPHSLFHSRAEAPVRVFVLLRRECYQRERKKEEKKNAEKEKRKENSEKDKRKCVFFRFFVARHKESVKGKAEGWQSYCRNSQGRNNREVSSQTDSLTNTVHTEREAKRKKRKAFRVRRNGGRSLFSILFFSLPASPSE